MADKDRWREREGGESACDENPYCQHTKMIMMQIQPYQLLIGIIYDQAL